MFTMGPPFLKQREACIPLLARETVEKHKSTRRALYMPPKAKEISYLVRLFAVSTLLMQLYILKNVSCTWPEDPVRSIMHAEVDVSIIILTYKKHLALAKLLPSVLEQRKCKFEIILADNGCLEDTKKVIDGTFGYHDTDAQPWRPLKYLPLCDNPGYAKGNNAAVALASPTSERLLFLNDDIVLRNPNFIYNMVRLLKSKEKAAAVGCKILNSNGTELIEAGSLIWDDASALGYGRGRKDINATEFSYAKPVDYVSGACLLVEKKVVENYGGFDGVHFPNYYEDTDLQMHIQHDLRKEVWLEPNSVALHDEHGSFGDNESTKLMQNAADIFRAKWGEALKDGHIANPWDGDARQQEMSLLLASDLRARDPKKANILFIDDKAPNKSRGSGYGRAFDNLSMISELGHRITLVTLYPPSENDWCDVSCLTKISGLGIEYETKRGWDEVFNSRIGFYDVVIVSRPDTLKRTFRKLREFYGQSPFSLIYDSEALPFLRDEKLDDLVNGPRGIPFPGYGEMIVKNMRSELRHVVLKARRSTEIALLSIADTVLAVSEGEKKYISKFSPETKDIDVIGHIMGLEPGRASGDSVGRRNGILCVASFANSMYYNGDAIWYFLIHVYPLVIAGSKSSSKRIPHLTIAGRGIPDELFKVVRANDVIASHVTFLESPPTLDALYASNRLFISPHLYGAGIQYKVSEAIAKGLPVVMSKFTYDSFGNDLPGCVGIDNESFAKCIIDTYNNDTQWATIQKKGTTYIRETHNRERHKQRLSAIIKRNLKIATSRKKNTNPDHNLLHVELPTPISKCEEGEEIYLKMYEDVAAAVVSRSEYSSAFQHWSEFGESEGRPYFCNEMPVIPKNAICYPEAPHPLCQKLRILRKKHLTVCCAGNVVSSTVNDYFNQIGRGKAVLPPGVQFRAETFKWTKLNEMDEKVQRDVFMSDSSDWTHVFLVRNVLQRFVLAYLDHVVRLCTGGFTSEMPIVHYARLGFSCESHSDLESFISFMESVPVEKMEALFAPQTQQCGFREAMRVNFTDIIFVDHTVKESLSSLSKKLGIAHPSTSKNESTSSHDLVSLFKGREGLIMRILGLFEEDCKRFPTLCKNPELEFRNRDI